ncbi:uncharacterized protein LOC143628133 [Bidens hawaiensis]|uniref:uncharacterized protein LOC143628133 n=1 Tax=Bidens hawaiensis TaxID=980011 RepID=UPI004049A1A2
MSSSPEIARVHSYNNIDDIGVTHKVNVSPKEVDDKFDKVHSEKSHLNEDEASSINMQTKEDETGHKGKENAGGGYILVSNIKSSFTLSLTNQGNKGSEDFLDKEVNKPVVDLDSSQSKEFEVRTNAKLSNMKLSSAKVNTWPLNQQKNVEDQLNCFSASQKFRVHIQRDAIHCDLETPVNGLNLFKESKLILSSEREIMMR